MASFPPPQPYFPTPYHHPPTSLFSSTPHFPFPYFPLLSITIYHAFSTLPFSYYIISPSSSHLIPYSCMFNVSPYRTFSPFLLSPVGISHSLLSFTFPPSIAPLTNQRFEFLRVCKAARMVSFSTDFCCTIGSKIGHYFCIIFLYCFAQFRNY